MKKIIIAGFCCFLAALWVHGQNPRPVITVKDIKVNLEPAPYYHLSGSQPYPKRPPNPDTSKKWLIVEAEIESEAEWADEVDFRFYVVANYGPTAKEYAPRDGYDILTAKVTVVNMPRNKGTGKKNIVPVFMDHNTVKKYGATGIQQFIPEVVVQVMYKGVLQHTKWKENEQKSGRFWEAKQPRTGVLVDVTQSPWVPAFADYYQQVKSSAAAPSI